MGTWTEKEKGVMRDFIKENPDIQLKTITIHPLLQGCFDGRTPEAVYHGWRRLRGLKRRLKGLKSRPKIKKQGDYILEEVPEFLSLIGELMEEFILSQIDKKSGWREVELLSENEELRKTINEIQKTCRQAGVRNHHETGSQNQI